MFSEEPILTNLTKNRATQQQLFSLLQTCRSLRNLIQIHTQVVVNGFSRKNYIIAKILSFYVASGCLQLAHDIFQNIKRPSTSVWNQMIRAQGRSDKSEKAVEFYNRMVAAEAEPDGFTYSFLLSACARRRLLREGEQVHCRVLATGYCSSVFVQTNLINLYAGGGGGSGLAQVRQVFDDMGHRSIVTWNSLLSTYIELGDFDGARRVFDEMPERNVVSWTTMIAGCSRIGKCKQALLFFCEMRRALVELDEVALLAALSACAELGDLKIGRWVHVYIEKRIIARNHVPMVSLSNALIHMYASCGMMDEAYKVFITIPQKTTVSWTSIIMGFAKQGRGEEALCVFQTMVSLEGDRVRPDQITFIGVLSACSHAGFVDEGRRIFECMSQTWRISPRIEHYGCMVDLLSRAGYLDEAQSLIKTMPMKPNDSVWGALLGGCKIYKNSELASQVAQNFVAELNPDRAAGYLVLLSNVYANTRRWQDVITIRRKMVETGVRKPSGRSSIQINGTIHSFIAGDVSHKHSTMIYETIDEITSQAHPKEYEQNMSQFTEVP